LTRIFLIRHAEAEGNIHRRAHGFFNGLIIGSGYEQIGRLKERFKDEKIDAVYSSDLDRAKTTAASISDPRGLTIIPTDKLREVNCGDWEDIAWGDLNYYQKEMAEFFGHDPERWKTNGSEDYYDVQQRMFKCISGIGARHDGGTAAVFSHGFAIRAFLCKLMGIPSNETDRVPYCDNTAVALLIYEDGRFGIEYHGDNSHLHSEISTFAKQTWWRDKRDRKSEDLHYVPFNEERDIGNFDASFRRDYSKTFADKKLLAVLDEKPAGILGLDAGRDSGSGVGWITQMYMKPELRRTKFGIQLLGQAVSEYRRQRRENIRIEVTAGSPAEEFCSKYEFKKTGGSDSIIIMEKHIKNWVD